MHDKVNHLALSENQNSRRYISLLVRSHKRKQDAVDVWEAFEHRVHALVGVCANTDWLRKDLWNHLVFQKCSKLLLHSGLSAGCHCKLRTLVRHAKRTQFPCTRHILEALFSNLQSSAKSKPIFPGTLKCTALNKE